MKNKNKPFGYWPSPITAEMVASSAKRFYQIQSDGGCVYWLEQRPAEGGRQVIMCCAASGVIETITPENFNVRTRVHEYGGGDYAVKDGIIYFVNAQDQRIYRQAKNEPPKPVVPESKNRRYADFLVTKNHAYLIAVREVHHDDRDPDNELVRINLSDRHDVIVLASGKDFYSNPVLNPDETKLAWLCWSHPQMPWDGTELWCASLENFSVIHAEKVAGSVTESLYQPEWSHAGELHVVSDRTGWWNIYKVVNNALTPIAKMSAEFGTTQWVFGTKTYAFTDQDKIICIVTKSAKQHIGWIESGKFKPFDVLLDTIEPYIAVSNQDAYFIAASPTANAALYDYDFSDVKLSCIANTSDDTVGPDYLSIPESITFAVEKNQSAYAFYYAPKNPEVTESQGLPPLIVFCHGGPVAYTTSALNLKIQYWTSRGFAVVDVNYSGSGGYGRAYRNRLKGQWGIVDVADCVAAAKYLVDQKRVDPQRLCIRGSSAGGFTVLNALAHYDLFAVGASYYGISDLTGLLTGMPKFESKDLELLVGEYPNQKARYYDRSPVHFANQIKAPIIFFQGLKDPVVPPAQAEMMIAAMEKSDVPYRYVTFAQERHGFKDGQNIAKALAEELAFYLSALYTDALYR